MGCSAAIGKSLVELTRTNRGLAHRNPLRKRIGLSYLSSFEGSAVSPGWITSIGLCSKCCQFYVRRKSEAASYTYPLLRLTYRSATANRHLVVFTCSPEPFVSELLTTFISVVSSLSPHGTLLEFRGAANAHPAICLLTSGCKFICYQRLQ